MKLCATSRLRRDHSMANLSAAAFHQLVRTCTTTRQWFHHRQVCVFECRSVRSHYKGVKRRFDKMARNVNCFFHTQPTSNAGWKRLTKSDPPSAEICSGNVYVTRVCIYQQCAKSLL